MTEKDEIRLIHHRMRRLLEELQSSGREQKALITDVLADAKRFDNLLDRVTQHRSLVVRKVKIPNIRRPPLPWYRRIFKWNYKTP